jgi:glycosyltransferase involved in cell wall biosynthesis
MNWTSAKFLLINDMHIILKEKGAIGTARAKQIETFCLTALESMACGTTVLAFRTGGLPDLIENQKTGLLVDHVGSQKEMAQRIQWALANRNLLKGMGEEARSAVEKKFTTEHYARAYETIYQQILAQ